MKKNTGWILPIHCRTAARWAAALSAVAIGILLAPASTAHAADTAAIKINPSQVRNKINIKIYGQFLEDIYYSADNGLWGENVYNRSFERPPRTGFFRMKAAGAIVSRPQGNPRYLFGDPAWKNYTLSCDVKKVSGHEGFMLMTRVTKGGFYWANVGGWNDTYTALARGTHNTLHTVGKTNPLTVRPSVWYHCKFICHGAHLVLKINGKTVLSYTDPHPRLHGRVGLASWNTSSEFRNVRVVNPAGKVLYRGLVTRNVPPPSPVAFWMPFGKGSVRRSAKNPLNSHWSVAIHGASVGETGLSQGAFCLRKNMAYSGSFFARGTVGAPIAIRMIDDDRHAVFQKTYKLKSKNWRRYPIQFTSSVTAHNATLTVGLVGRGRVNIDEVSLMSARSRADGGFRPDLLAAVKALKPASIRWPGGAFADFYRWKDGIGPEYKRVSYPIRLWHDRDTDALGTDEFMRLCKDVGAQPIVVVNGLYGKTFKQAAHRAAEWVEYCNSPDTNKWGALRAKNGHPGPYHVKYWEIDNETWNLGVAKYNRMIATLVPAMKKVNPHIKIIVCGNPAYQNRGWSKAILKVNARLINYLSPHEYGGWGDPERYSKFIAKMGQWIAHSANPHIKIDYSEWGSNTTWGGGLYAGDLLSHMERLGKLVHITSPALFLRRAGPYGWNDALINFNQCGWFPGGEYTVGKLWRDYYAPLRIAASGSVRRLHGVATMSADQKTVYFKAINHRGAVAVDLQLQGAFTPGAAAVHAITAKSLSTVNTFQDPHRFKSVPVAVRVSGQHVRFTLPALAAAVVVIHEASPAGGAK